MTACTAALGLCPSLSTLGCALSRMDARHRKMLCSKRTGERVARVGSEQAEKKLEKAEKQVEQVAEQQVEQHVSAPPSFTLFV